MQCPRCRYESPAGARFCGECGAPLGRTCPDCGIFNPPGNSYCSACGRALDRTAAPARTQEPHDYTPKYLAERILRGREAIEGERKQVTVLFADLRGSLEILAARDPEDARQILDPVLERMMEAVHRFEGTVNQVMGDGIMALFGAPLAHEDHAVRACYAALRMQESIETLSEELRQAHGLSVRIRVGVNSGEVVVRSVGSDLRMDYTAVGQSTHLAARMEQLAAPGQTLLTEYTLRLAEGFVSAKSLGPVPIKGLVAPVTIYELTGPGPIRSKLQLAAARGLSRFVGRNVELADLIAAAKQARSGRGQVVALVGEPGVGKSRLVREFTAGQLSEDWRILEAFATPFDTSAAYLPMISLLRAYFELQEGDDVRATRDKVTAAIFDLDQSLLEALPALLTLLEVPVDEPGWHALDPRQRRRRTLDALRRLLIRESQRRPLCLIFEDLHWIDGEAQAVLDALVESLPATRILLVATYRPEYTHGWGQKTYYAQIAVHPLPEGMAEEMLRDILGDGQGAGPEMALLRARLIQRTEGNPFFLEESLRHLVDTGVLAGERGSYRLALAAATVDVPPTVQALLAARIDQLSLEDKRVLQCAAVIGKDVPLPLLEAISDVSDDELQRSLHHLQRAEFVYEASLFPVAEYTFKHALTLDVALGSLLQERRNTLDARIVAAVETTVEERTTEHVERLAHHAFRGGVWDKAVTYCREAGARALARSAHRTDVRYFEQALQALKRLPEKPDTLAQAIDVRLDLRAALAPIGEYGRMLEVLTEAEKLARTLDDPRRLGPILSFLTNFVALRGDFDRAIALGEEARTIAATLGDPGLELLSGTLLSLAYFLGPSDFEKVIAAGETTLRLLEGDREHERFGMALPPAVYSRTVMAWALAEQGFFARGLGIAHAGLHIAERLNHPHSVVFALLGVGTLHLRRGDFPQAIRTLERGHDICESEDLPAVFLEVAQPLGSAYAQAGQAPEAVALLERAVSQAIALKHRLGHWLRSGGMAEAYLAAGRLDEALPLAELFLQIMGMVKARGAQAWAQLLLGEITARMGPDAFERSESALEAALASAESLGMRPLAARCHLALGDLCRRNGKHQRSAAHLTLAATVCSETDMPYWFEKAKQAQADAREDSLA
jgi:class 3 adenylate cyclase/tetratricopeptide (TPR) repeat protein